MNQRLSQLIQWVSAQLQLTEKYVNDNLSLLAGDASFRCYYRLAVADKSYVIMDSPPDLEPVMPFIHIDQSLAALGLQVTKIFAQNTKHGFLLLEDFGDELLFNILNQENVGKLYKLAIQQMVLMHGCQGIANYQIGSYDNAMYSLEMARFVEWFLQQYLSITLTQQQVEMLDTIFQLLINSALEQPQVFVHRDFHSRNLLLLKEDKIGIIDFQDSVWGAITYDVVSLLRDCYIAWPDEQVKQSALYFKQLAWSELKLEPIDDMQFLKWFDWMGLERHLKCLYIFARKYCRDGQTGYLSDIPRTMNYILAVSEQYKELHPLFNFMQNTVQPRLNEIL